MEETQHFLNKETVLNKKLRFISVTLDTRLALYAAKAFKYSFLAASVFFL
jgi:hypothetical protein